MVELVAQSGNVDDSLRLRGVESHRGKGHYAAKAISVRSSSVLELMVEIDVLV